MPSLAPPPPPDRSCTPTTPPVCLPPGIQSPPASDADDSLAGFRAVDCPLRVDEVFLAIGRTTVIGSTLGASNNPPRRAGTTLLWRTFTMIANRHRTIPVRSCIVTRHLHYARIRKTGGRRTSYSFQSGTPTPQGGRSRRASWPVTSTARGVWFVCKKGQASSPIVLWRKTST